MFQLNNKTDNSMCRQHFIPKNEGYTTNRKCPLFIFKNFWKPGTFCIHLHYILLQNLKVIARFVILNLILNDFWNILYNSFTQWLGSLQQIVELYIYIYIYILNYLNLIATAPLIKAGKYTSWSTKVTFHFNTRWGRHQIEQVTFTPLSHTKFHLEFL